MDTEQSVIIECPITQQNATHTIPYEKDTAGNAHWVVHYGILAQGLPLNSTMDSPQGIPLYINPQVYWVVPWVYKHRSHKPKVRRFGTFTDWTFQKVALYVQVQKL